MSIHVHNDALAIFVMYCHLSGCHCISQNMQQCRREHAQVELTLRVRKNEQHQVSRQAQASAAELTAMREAYCHAQVGHNMGMTRVCATDYGSPTWMHHMQGVACG